MGSELVDRSSPSYTEIFHEQLPYYIAIGMPYDLYWNGDCRLAERFRRADEIKRKRTNQDLWLQGLYIYEALCDVAPVLHAFSKNPKPAPYSPEPYAITQLDIDELRKKQEKDKFEQTKTRMETWAAKTNAQMTAREEAADGCHD